MNWLLELLDKLFFWLPRFCFVQPDEGGIRLTLGKHIKKCPPGWYIDWPLIHVFHKVSIAIQGVRFAVQSVITNDDIDLAIRGAILYRITDAEKAILVTDDFDDALEALVCGIVEEFAARKTYDEMRDREALKNEIMKGIRDRANEWGIKLIKTYISDIGRVSNIRVLSNQSSHVPIPIEGE